MSQKRKPKTIATLAKDDLLLDMTIKRLQAKEIALNIEQWESRHLANEDSKTIIEKVLSLATLLQSITVDDERTILGSEPLMKSVFTKHEREIIVNRIMSLIIKY